MAVPVRKASIGIAALAGASLLSAFPAASQQVADAERPTSSEVCKGFTVDQAKAMVRCHVREMDKRIERNKRDTVIIQQQGVAAKERNDAAETCNAWLKAGRDTGQFTREKVVELAGGKVTVDNACDIARKLGYVGPKAAAPSHTVR